MDEVLSFLLTLHPLPTYLLYIFMNCKVNELDGSTPILYELQPVYENGKSFYIEISQSEVDFS